MIAQDESFLKQAPELHGSGTALKIIGSYLSPYVRKVLVVLHIKGIAYEIDPIVPFFGDERFTAMSPLRRIPVLIDDRAAPRRYAHLTQRNAGEA